MNTLSLWLRWSWRDLRTRWLQVLAIGIIIALGTGAFAGLGSGTPWRQASNDDSYALLNMYDLRVTMTRGSYVKADDLLNTLQEIEHTAWIKRAEVRLISSTSVDASTDSQAILVPGRIIGVNVMDDGTHINGTYITGGRALGPGDTNQQVAILEDHFVRYYKLPPQGKIRLSGDIALDYVGTGMSPEYFMVITDEGGMMAEANFAAVFVPLAVAQSLADQPGMANDLLLTLNPGADKAVLQAEIDKAVLAASGVSVSFMEPKDDEAYNMLYSDIGNDEMMWMLIAYLFLAGAAFGAFNLANRMVEAQRRQIGINMALGVPPRLIAIRPLLVALQIALLGVIFGIFMGFFFGDLFGKIMRDMLPMPIFNMPFRMGIFLKAALLGIAIPFVATLYPVWRAVRVEPIDAIRTGHLVAKGGGLSPLVAHLPGKSYTQMPLRNLLRSPRRTLLTLLGIAMAIVTLVAVMGMLDAFLITLDAGKKEYLQNTPQRMTADLNFFYPLNSPVIQAIQQSPTTALTEPVLHLGGYLMHNGVTVESFLDMINLESTLWKPTVIQGSLPIGKPGLLLAEKAARDLNVKPGQTITLKHPKRDGLFSFRMVETEIEVTGIHAGPFRFMSYMDIGQAQMMGLQGLSNMVQFVPAANATQDDVKRALFGQMGVTTVQPVAAVITVFEDLIAQFVGILWIVVYAVILMAFLITYNSTSINVDERAREIATMFAFGTPVREVTRMAMVENLITGILGTLVGLGLGYIALIALLTNATQTTMPELSVTIGLSPSTLGMAALFGVGVVMLTPLLSIRKMIGMDIPATLRVME